MEVRLREKMHTRALKENIQLGVYWVHRPRYASSNTLGKDARTRVVLIIRQLDVKELDISMRKQHNFCIISMDFSVLDFLTLPRKLLGMVFLWGRYLHQFGNFLSHGHRTTMISCSFLPLLPVISPLCHPSLPFLLLYYWFRLNVNWQSFICDNRTLSLSR